MATTYNQIAGQNVGRLAALSDGLFAVAMTLLVLDLWVPDILVQLNYAIALLVGLLSRL